MINCDFKVDLFGHRMTEVFKGFGRGMAQWLWDLRQGIRRLSLPTSEPASSVFSANVFRNSLSRVGIFRRSLISGVGR
jgi:hypothetical protein